MVCLYTLISEIISEIVLDNTLILLDNQSNVKFAVDLNYLRHHPKLKNAKIFRMIFGFEQGLWKKPEYDKKRYAKIFNDYNFSKEKWLILREYLNTNKVSGMTEYIIQSKKNMLFDISCTFGSIPTIDEYLTEETKEKTVQYYIPVKPEDDFKCKYLWSIIDDNTLPSIFSTWIMQRTRSNWEIVNIEKIGDISRYYARRSKVL
jgi:hypothetical protein